MNKSKYILSSVFSVLLLCCMLSSCEDQFPGMTPSLEPINLSVDRQSISFSPSEYGYVEPPASQTINIKAEDTDWIITGKPSWITLNKEKGSGNASVKVSADVYYCPDSARTATIYVRSTDANSIISIPITIEQKKANEYLNLSKTGISFDKDNTLQKVTLESNCDWTWWSNCSWVSVESKLIYTKNSLNTYEITVFVEPNTYDYSRSSTIYFKTSNKSISLNISQSKY